MPRIISILAVFLFTAAAAPTAPRSTVGLTLELLDRRPRVSQPLFIRLTLKNQAPKGEMIVADWKYRGGDELYRDWLQASEGLGLDYIELLGPDGKPVPRGRYDDLGPASRGPADIRIGKADVETSSRVAVLRAQGLSLDEIERRLALWEHQAAEESRRKKFPAHFLAPGESLRTASFCTLKARCPGNGYAQLPFNLTKPGRYRIRAVYDHNPPSIPSGNPWEIRVLSRWVDFEVRK